MFSIGDKVLYGKTGVCIIEDTCEKELIKGNRQSYYVLRPVFSDNSVIYAPIGSEKIFIRPVMTKAEADGLILKIPEISKTAPAGVLSVQEYEEIINTHKCEDLVRLTHKLYVKKQTAMENRKKTGFVDEKYTALAEKLLFGELACALEIPLEEVKGYIKQKLKTI